MRPLPLTQGLDLRRHSYDQLLEHLNAPAAITITDYNSKQSQVMRDVDNKSLADALSQPRPEWSKVRWVNVQGLSWDVIQALAHQFKLHPLSVEDMMQVPQRIKADYYQDYLYTSAILVSVDQTSQLEEITPQNHPDNPGSDEPSHAGSAGTRQHHSKPQFAATRPEMPVDRAWLKLHAAHGSRPVHVRPKAARSSSHSDQISLTAAAGASESANNAMACQASDVRLQPMHVRIEQASFLLFRDGTLVSLFSSLEGTGIAQGILRKIQDSNTLLTDSEDASFLFNALLDAVVDHKVPVVELYRARISDLEAKVLVQKWPQASLTKELHLLGNDLKGLRRLLVPMRSLVVKLQGSAGAARPGNQAEAFLSPASVLYMSDVLDHISSIVDDMEVLSEDTRDLVDLVFNTISHNNNASMQMLAVVSTVFLPITFIAGVYGTNFRLPEVQWQYGYTYFWTMCVTVTTAFAVLLRRWGLFRS
eukprot:gene12011-12155_t